MELVISMGLILLTAGVTLVIIGTKIQMDYLKAIAKIDKDSAEFYLSLIKKISKDNPGIVNQAFKEMEEK